MNEKKAARKKEIIKNVAIVFLIIMLLLTLFSNTFRNYSLPEVTMVNPSSNIIKEQARGNGQVTAGETFAVNATESRVVSSVAVKKGDHVEIGDPLFYLSDVESDELITAQEEYDKAKNEYLKAFLSLDMSSESIVKAKTGNFDSIPQWQSKLSELEGEIEEKQAIYEEYLNNAAAHSIENAYQTYINTNWTEQVIKAELEAELAQLENKDVQMAFTLEKAKKSEELQAKMNEILYDAGVTSLEALYNSDEDAYNDYIDFKEQKSVLDVTLYENEQGIVELAQKLAAVTRAVNADEAKAKVNAAKDAAYNQPNKIYYENIKADIDALKEERDSYIKDMTAQIAIEGFSDALATKRDKLEKIKANCQGAVISADVAGTVSSVDVVAGEKTEKQKQIATIIPDGKGYSLDITVDAKQAEKVKIGDPGELEYYWNHENAKLLVKSIKDDTENPGKKKIITFSVEGDDFTIGENLSVSVGSKSENYDLTVPKAAINNDKDGKFVMVLSERKTPFGKRYIANRVEVTEKASDDERVAVSGSLSTMDYVIVASTKPLSDGEEFRIKEE